MRHPPVRTPVPAFDPTDDPDDNAALPWELDYAPPPEAVAAYLRGPIALHRDGCPCDGCVAADVGAVRVAHRVKVGA